MSPSAGTATLGEIRDCLARPFGEAIGGRTPQVLDLLEQQLATTEDRGRWKPLKSAIDLLKALRPTLAARVTREVAKRFDAKVSPGEDGFSKTARFTLDSLSLVEDAQVQEEIALGNTTKRLRDQLGDELFTLTRRVAAVMGREDLADDASPVYPRVFARALMDALNEPGEGDVPGRLAAYSAFGPVLLEEVASVYASTNAMLRQRGVLPDFKRSYGAPVQAVRRIPAADARAGESPGPAAAEENAPLDRLFAMAAAPPALAPAAAGAGPGGTVTLNVRPELVEALRALEPRLEALLAASHALPAAPADATVAAAPAGSAAVHQAKNEMRASLRADDVVVADLVAALFDRLFVDPRLSDATRAQIGRLQIPVFKAVLQDRTFFTDRRHPIRMLIDSMAELGAADELVDVDGVSPPGWIADVVAQVLEHHAEDPKAFAKGAERLAAALERHREAALEHDTHVRDLRKRELQLIAVREASLVIAHRLAAASCPQEAEVYLYGRFREVLVHDYLASGEDSGNWKSDLEVVDDLLWVLTPRVDAEEKSRLAGLVPSLLFRLRMGYLRAGLAPEVAAQHVDELKQLLDEVARAPVAAAHGTLRKTAPAMPVDDYTATLHVSSGSLAEEGLARGAWFEFTDDDGSKHRCRLNWISPVQGTCLFKDLERNRSFAISVDDMRERRRSGRAALVDGPGVAQASIDGAIDDVARSLQAPARRPA